MGKDGGGMTTLTEAARAALRVCDAALAQCQPCAEPDCRAVQSDYIQTARESVRAALAASEVQAGPVAWRQHAEQRIRSWRQRTMNRSGDMLSLDDFMSAESIDDLVDFVCDEWVHPPAPEQPAPALASAPRVPQEQQIRALLWDEHPECCGSPVVGAEYMGQQEMLCCGCPEPALLNDAQIVASLRAMFPEAPAPQPEGDTP